MPEISMQKQCSALTDLVHVDSFGEPVGDLPKQTDSSFFEEGNFAAGTWECEAGDSWVFPKGWKSTGEVLETVRKIYIVISG